MSKADTKTDAKEDRMMDVMVYDQETQAEKFRFKMRERLVKLSDTWLGMLEIPGMEAAPEVLITIEYAKSPELLEKYKEYCEFMTTGAFPMEERKEGKRIETELTKWEKDYIASMSQEMLFELVLLSNFLSNLPMLEALTCGVAGLLRGKSPEEIRKIFQIRNDFTKEEEEKINKENQFIEEAQVRT